MYPNKRLSLFLVGLTIIFFSLACGTAPLAGVGEPPATEAPAAEAAEPAEAELPAVEEPPEAEPPPMATQMPASAPLPTPTLVGEIPLTGSGFEKSGPGPLIPESRLLTLEFPPLIRTGDAVRIRLQLEMDDRGGIIPTAVVEGNVVTGEVVEIPNLYDTHNVIAESRLDMAGMQVQPPGTISEPLKPRQPVTFFWSLRAPEPGNYQGTAWLHLRFVPREAGEESRIPISVQFLEIEAKSFLGILPGSTARGVGVLGSLVGTVMGFPFAGEIAKWLWGRIRKK